MQTITAKVQDRNLAHRLSVTTLAAGTFLAVTAHSSLAQVPDQAQVMVDQSEEYGQYITDADGRALYLFTADQQGSGGAEASSNCYDACAEAWPPLLTTEEPVAGSKAQEDLLGTIERRDGLTQVTYGGWPLYYYVKDQAAGQTTGQDVHGFGGEWYLVTPDGQQVEESGGEQSNQAAQQSVPAADSSQAEATAGAGENRLIATVNDVEIRQQDVLNAIQNLPPQVRQMPPQMLLPIVVEQLLTRELILERAMAQDLQSDPAVTAIVEPQIEALQEQAIIDVWLDRALAERITEEQINAAYEEFQAANPDAAVTLEVARPQLEQALRQQAMRELAAQLREGAAIVFFDASGNPLPEGASGQTGAAGEGQGSAAGQDGAASDQPASEGQEGGAETPLNTAPEQNN